jgi:hypothetical protein
MKAVKEEKEDLRDLTVDNPIIMQQKKLNFGL